MNARIYYILPVIFWICIILCSCNKDELENICTEQEVAIDSFIGGKYADSTVVRNAGSSRIVLEQGFGDEAQTGNSVKITYTGYIFNNGPGELFADAVETNVSLDDNNVIFGLRNGIIGMKEGESAYVVFSARYGFYNQHVGTIPSMSALIYYVTLHKINSQ